MGRRRRGPTVGAVLGIGGAAAISAAAIPLAQAGTAAPATTRVSMDMSGGDPNGFSWDPYISADGRYVVYASLAGDIVPGDTNGFFDIFVRDTVTGTTTRESVDMNGGNTNGLNQWNTISPDGRYVGFMTRGTDLVPGDTNGVPDVILRDLQNDTNTLVSVDMNGGPSNGGSSDPRISPGGRYVVFSSFASDLVPGDTNGLSDIFRRDLQTGTTVMVTVDMTGGPSNGTNLSPSMSDDGRYVDFYSDATDLAPGDTNGVNDVYVRDLVAGVTTRASRDMGGGDPNDTSVDPDISRDGRYIAFYSKASDLVTGDNNGEYDVYRWDRLTGVTTRVSVDMAGGDTNGRSVAPNLSQNGSFVVFTSRASDLVPGDTNGGGDVFVRDMVAGTTVLVSVSTSGVQGNGPGFDPTINADGTWVTFDSFASNLVTGDTNNTADVFLRQMS